MECNWSIIGPSALISDNECGVFAFGCYFGFFWGNPALAVVAVCFTALFTAIMYSIESESLTQWSVVGFGLSYLAVSIGAYIAIAATNNQVALILCASLAFINACAFVWFTYRTRMLISAHIATLGILEAVTILLFQLLTIPAFEGIHRAGFALISALFLLAAWALSNRRESEFAQALCVVGLVVLSIDVLISVAMWLFTFSANDRLMAFVVTSAAAAIYGIYSTVAHSRWSHWSAMLTLTVAYGLGGALWVMPHFTSEYENYGAWFWPLAAALALCGHCLHRKDERESAWIFLVTSAAMVTISVAIQPMYCVLTEFIALIAYGLLFAWTAVAGRSWAQDKYADILSECFTYASAVMLAVGWLLLFEYVGALYSNMPLYRCAAALTGVIWCAAAFHLSTWISSRGWNWWARSLFWSGLVLGILWNAWPVIWHQSIYPLSLMISALTIIMYSLIY